MKWGDQIVLLGQRLNDINDHFRRHVGEQPIPPVDWSSMPIPRTPSHRRTPETLATVMGRVLDEQERREQNFSDADLQRLMDRFASLDNRLIGIKNDMRRFLDTYELRHPGAPVRVGEFTQSTQQVYLEIHKMTLGLAGDYGTFVRDILALWSTLFDD